MKVERKGDLLRILHEGRASTQKEIAHALHAAGHDVTQATVSRDLRDVGAAKVRVNGRFVYRLPDEIPREGDVLALGVQRALAEFAMDVRAADNLVVVLTVPGHAGAVARAIDLAGVSGVVGTIAGDDTIFVATDGVAAARRIAHVWRGEQDETEARI